MNHYLLVGGSQKKFFFEYLIEEWISRAIVEKYYENNTLSQYPGWTHTGKLPGKNQACKTTPQWKKV